MFRKDLIVMLLHNPMTPGEISRRAGTSEKRLRDDLQHVIKSLLHGERRLFVWPACCRKCGFEFGAEKLSKPSRCLKCRSGRIDEPLLEIRER